MVVILVLVSVLIMISFQSGILGTADASFTWNNYGELFSDSILREALSNTVVFSITATLVSIGIGLPIAWVTERTTLYGKSAIYAIMTQYPRIYSNGIIESNIVEQVVKDISNKILDLGFERIYFQTLQNDEITAILKSCGFDRFEQEDFLYIL